MSLSGSMWVLFISLLDDTLRVMFLTFTYTSTQHNLLHMHANRGTTEVRCGIVVNTLQVRCGKGPGMGETCIYVQWRPPNEGSALLHPNRDHTAPE